MRQDSVCVCARVCVDSNRFHLNEKYSMHTFDGLCFHQDAKSYLPLGHHFFFTWNQISPFSRKFCSWNFWRKSGLFGGRSHFEKSSSDELVWDLTLKKLLINKIYHFQFKIYFSDISTSTPFFLKKKKTICLRYFFYHFILSLYMSLNLK